MTPMRWLFCSFCKKCRFFHELDRRRNTYKCSKCGYDRRAL